MSYAKFGSFFCDCGAKGEGACQALTRRSPAPPPPSYAPPAPPPPPPQRSPSRTFIRSAGLKLSTVSAEARAGLRSLLEAEGSRRVAAALLTSLSWVSPAVAEGAEAASGSGALARRRAGLAALLGGPLPPLSRRRALVTSGRGEEPCRILGVEKASLGLGGDESSTLRQLLQSRILRRRPLAILTPPSAPAFVVLAQEKSRVR